MSDQKNSDKKIIIIGSLIVIVLVILFAPIIPYTHTVQVPYQKTETYTDYETQQVTQHKTETLINDKPTVPAGKYVYYRIHIDISDKQNNVIQGRVVETAGYDINFYVFDQENYNLWKDGKTAAAYVSAKRIESYDFSFVPGHSDYYYFVLDNTYSWFTNKVPEITATWNYVITTTQSVPVQKTRTVTEYKTVTETKYVSLFQILTGNI